MFNSVGYEMHYKAPALDESSFSCPYCRALAQQSWYDIRCKPRVKPILMFDRWQVDVAVEDPDEPDTPEEMQVHFSNEIAGTNHFLPKLTASSCFSCRQVSLWIGERLIHPKTGEAPPANSDLPSDIRADYDEASSILDLSPRGAAALIRLAIQKLCKHLGQPGKNINDDIAALVRGGLPPRVQKALDAVRLIGNEAVHPGTMDLKDDRETAVTLFMLLNLIVEKTITEEKFVDDIYDSLPPSKRAQIEKRDAAS